MSWRRLDVIIRHLPPTSALHRALDPDGTAWDTQAHLLAVIADILQGANWQRGGNAKAPRPKPLPRPGEARQRDQKLARMAARWKQLNQTD